MKKSDFIKHLQENQGVNLDIMLGKDTDLSKVTTSDVQNISKTVDAIGDVKKKIEDIGINDSSVSEEEQLNHYGDTDNYKGLIDQLMMNLYGMPYFNATADKKPVAEYTPEELARMKATSPSFIGSVNQIQKGIESLNSGIPGKTNPLRNTYLTLQNMSENLVSNPIFHIIAESETPKISKQEIIELLKK